MQGEHPVPPGTFRDSGKYSLGIVQLPRASLLRPPCAAYPRPLCASARDDRHGVEGGSCCEQRLPWRLRCRPLPDVKSSRTSSGRSRRVGRVARGTAWGGLSQSHPFEAGRTHSGRKGLAGVFIAVCHSLPTAVVSRTFQERRHRAQGCTHRLGAASDDCLLSTAGDAACGPEPPSSPVQTPAPDAESREPAMLRPPPHPRHSGPGRHQAARSLCAWHRWHSGHSLWGRGLSCASGPDVWSPAHRLPL